MKIKLPSPDTMDKAVLVIAILGVIIAFLTIKNVPTPEEHNNHINNLLDDLIVLQTMSGKAIDNQDYQSACKLQQQSTDMVLRNNLFDLIDAERLFQLEEIVCEQANKNLI